MTLAHAVGWIDHQRAAVVHLSSLDEQTTQILSSNPRRKLHRGSGVPGTGRAPVSHAFFDDVARCSQNVPRVLVVGPGVAKVEFVTHLTQRHPSIAGNVACPAGHVCPKLLPASRSGRRIRRQMSDHSVAAPTLQFVGGAGTVTGSKYLVRTDGAAELVDCGLLQGPREPRERDWDVPPFELPRSRSTPSVGYQAQGRRGRQLRAARRARWRGGKP